MEEYVGLDVSMEETSVCVMDTAGEIKWEGKVATEPGELVPTLRVRAPTAVKVGLETGPARPLAAGPQRDSSPAEPVSSVSKNHAAEAPQRESEIDTADRRDRAELGPDDRKVGAAK